jgi:hypothetical protein
MADTESMLANRVRLVLEKHHDLPQRRILLALAEAQIRGNQRYPRPLQSTGTKEMRNKFKSSHWYVQSFASRL